MRQIEEVMPGVYKITGQPDNWEERKLELEYMLERVRKSADGGTKGD